ncbi:SOS response-associated peptidase [Thioalkalivibrio sp. XN8]|uniref:SOS response-associated peptidase n=1 Tax=Thioalkalivibrio sp. XN8 TaxID=2712863 RepID=UPI0013EA7FE4|nr:SOS response-associated peptidase [Thioalkalivibrio sp. XN8]NGP52563.1 SOS response-associated peptidase [Thioalkalivibrio sp. XN8]
MCGRYALYTPIEAVARLFGVSELHAHDLDPRYNIAPTQEVPIVRRSPYPVAESGAEPARELALARWGLVPFWAKDPSIGNRMINARGETAAGKPAFRNAFRKRRCLVPADGFFEWQKTADGKQPWYIRDASGEPMALAGLWELWDPPEGGEPLASCAIITTAANELMRPLHDRMPVILDQAGREAWLDPAAKPERLEALLAPAPDGILEAWPVSRRVNSPFNEDPSLVEPA